MFCPSCGSQKTKLAGYSSPTRFLKYNDCGLYFASPIPDVESLRKIYDSYVDKDWPMSREEIETIVFHPTESDRFKSRVVRGFSGRFLDVGFGSAIDLVRALRLGFQVYGIELSRSRLSFARNILGFSEVFFGNLKEQSFPDEFFDVVMCWHVIEHVLDVDDFLDEVHLVLKPGGVLILGAENVEGLFPRLVRCARARHSQGKMGGQRFKKGKVV